MKRYFLNIFLLASFFGMGQAIKFSPMGSGLGNGFSIGGVRSLFYDTIDKKLYASGQFQNTGNKIFWGAAVWENNTWDTLQGGFTQYPQQLNSPGATSNFAQKIIRYKNKIYFAGGIVWVNGKNQYNLAVWNGINWDYPLPHILSSNSVIYDMMVYKDTLYVCGTFTSLGILPYKYVAKFDGSNWYPVGNFLKYSPSTPAQMAAITVYKNEIYVGGAWDDSLGITRNIAKFNGTEWVNVGTGIQQGGVNSVFALQEFNNELYIGGLFSRTSQIPGQGFIKWNGFNYEQVSSYGLRQGDFVSHFVKHKDKLFVMGGFTAYGPDTTYALFYIDSTKQCVINGLNSIWANPANINWEVCEFIGDSLIVGGLYQYLDTVLVNNIGAITNYENNSSCLITGIKENYFDNNLIRIYPNPVNNLLNLEIETRETKKIELNISNSIGQLVYSKGGLDQKQEIDLSFLPSGIYFLKLQNNSKQKVYKIVKE